MDSHEHQLTIMHNRTTSAGYRIPIKKAPRPASASSEYHNKCAPPAVAPKPQGNNARKSAASTGYGGVDVVTNDKIWRQNLHKEKNGARQWKDNWGFLAEYNDRGDKKEDEEEEDGEKKEVEELPEKVNMFSSAVPNTNSGNYGKQAGTEEGIHMQKLEFQLFASNRKRKLGNDLICY